MSYLFYKTFTWIILILIALFGSAFVGFVLGALGMYWILEEFDPEKYHKSKSRNK